MGRIVDKLRAILTTGVAGGVLGSLFGAAVLGVGAFVSPGEVTAGFFLIGVAVTGGVGTFIGSGFGVLLALSKGRSLEDLGLGRSAALGAIAGAAFPAVAALVTGGWFIPLELGRVAFLVAVFGPVGAGLAAGLVAVAKDAKDPTLSPGSSAPLLGSGDS